jgi:hypothetical protein
VYFSGGRAEVFKGGEHLQETSRPFLCNDLYSRSPQGSLRWLSNPLHGLGILWRPGVECRQFFPALSTAQTATGCEQDRQE